MFNREEELWIRGGWRYKSILVGAEGFGRGEDNNSSSIFLVSTFLFSKGKKSYVARTYISVNLVLTNECNDASHNDVEI